MTLRRLVSLLFAAAIGTAVSAQVAPPTPSTPAAPAPDENLNLRFANGIVAIAEDKIITVADVSREIGPMMQGLRSEAKSQKEFEERVSLLQDNAIQDLIDRVLIIKEFRKDEKKQIPTIYVDNQVADRMAEQFDNDRSKFLAYLKARGTTVREFRREVEEDMIYHYMQGEQRKSQSVVSPVRIEKFYNENKDQFYREDEVHLRLIQMARSEGESDESLKEQANVIMARLKAGDKFEELAKEYSRDARRSKGGDWGKLKRSDFRKEFSDVAFNLKVGEASEPLILPEGCFILFAEDRTFAGIQPIDEVRDQIEKILAQQMTRSSHERWLERLRRNGYIKHY